MIDTETKTVLVKVPHVYAANNVRLDQFEVIALESAVAQILIANKQVRVSKDAVTHKIIEADGCFVKVAA